MINIDEKRFYIPKVVLCGGIWLVLTLSMVYMNLQQTVDPSFHWSDHLDTFYSVLQVVSCILFFLYSSYFVIIAYVAFFQIKDMKKSYKFSLFLTFGVICACIFILLGNGMQASQKNSKLLM